MSSIILKSGSKVIVAKRESNSDVEFSIARVVGAWRRTDQTRAGGAARRDQPLSNLSDLIDDRAFRHQLADTTVGVLREAKGLLA